MQKYHDEPKQYKGYLKSALVGVPRKPWRPGLPIRDPSEGITIWHLYLRQTLGVEYCVLRDDIVDKEQIGRQRVDLISGERPLSIEGHATIDVVPHHRGVWRANREDPSIVPRVGAWLRFAFDQPGGAAPDPVRSVARRDPLRWTSSPSSGVPRPGGSSSPVGLMEISQARISSSLGVRPTPYVGDCATAEPRSSIRNSRSLSKPIVNAPITRDSQRLNGIILAWHPV